MGSKEENRDLISLGYPGKGHPSWCGTVTVHRAGHKDQHTTATWSPATQPAGRSLGTTPQNHSEELPPHPRTATLPQTRSLDLQVIQGQAGARLVHGVVGDCDACRKAQEKTRECESELRTENLAPNLRGPGSAWE